MSTPLHIPDNVGFSKLINKSGDSVWLTLPDPGRPVPLPTGNASYDFLLGTPDRHMYGFKGSTLHDLSNPNVPTTLNGALGSSPKLVGAYANNLVWTTSSNKVFMLDPSQLGTVTQLGTLPAAASALVGNSTGLYAITSAGAFYKYASGTWTTVTVNITVSGINATTLVQDTIYLSSAAGIWTFANNTLTALQYASGNIGEGNITAITGVSVTHNHDYPNTNYLYATVGDQTYCVFLTDGTHQVSQVMSGPGTDVKSIAMSQFGFLYWLNGTALSGCNPLGLFDYYLPPGDNDTVLALPNIYAPVTMLGATYQFLNTQGANPTVSLKVNWESNPQGQDYDKAFYKDIVVNGVSQGEPEEVTIENPNQNAVCNSLVMHVNHADGGWTVVVIGIDPVGIPMASLGKSKTSGQ